MQRRNVAGGVQHFSVAVDGHTYDVSVRDSDAQRLAPGAALEDLVRESFAFLLEREPAGSILQRFDLTVIKRYFPEYPREIRRRLGGDTA